MCIMTWGKIDDLHLSMLRDNIDRFLLREASKFSIGSRVLNIGCGKVDLSKYFPASVWETLEIDGTYNPTYCCDICEYNSVLGDNSYDCVLLIEVLEHTTDPFSAAREIYRILKPGGFALVTVPFNFAIHDSDYFRFTSEGLKRVFTMFSEVYIERLESPDSRPHMPIQFTMSAKKHYIF
jgi:SAM-dependent methyltransferase